MTRFSNKDSQWKQVVIFDSEALPGKNIYKIVKTLQIVLDFNFIFLSNIEGAGTSVFSNNSFESVLEIEDFMKKINDVQQVDWGDFFLFQKYPDNWKSFQYMDYKEMVPLTETTVRAVDDTYIYVYTPYDKVVEQLNKMFSVESTRLGFVNELDFPF